AQAGIQEYWIVDPQEKVIEIYTLEDDRYLLLGRFGQGDTARSKLLSSFEVTVQEVLA
ncbi:MAG TPA: Uma2 family endonuclease, partial [Anaerolineae bacterium]|nr:Uma2 family endonuclease [Anaerolineae bacterium]